MAEEDPKKSETEKKEEGAAAEPATDKDAPKDSEPQIGATGTENTGESLPAGPHEETEEHSNRVYVGNLAWEVTSQDLTDHMKNGGLEVKSANVMLSHDGRSKGCGIVEFNGADAAQQAVQTMNETELKGRQIFVREDRGERKSTGGRGYGRGRGSGYGGRGGSHFSSNSSKERRVYVGNLSWEVAWQDLKDHMVQAGDVIRAEVIKEPGGRSKGCGIVEFATEEGAKTAISTLTDTELKGRRIFVREDREITKQGGPGGRGGGRGRSYGGRRSYNNR